MRFFDCCALISAFAKQLAGWLAFGMTMMMDWGLDFLDYPPPPTPQR
jgi:hypothetical protein